MRVLVTGGAGFIGSHIVEAALARGHQVWVVDNLSSGKRENVPSAATLVELDIRNGQKLSELVGELRPDVITHQAAQVSVSVSTREPLLDAEVNVLGSLNVANAAVAHKVQRLVFASTGGAIYGEVPEGKRAREGDPMVPMSPYGCSKLAFEGYLPYYRQALGLSCTVLRYGNVYGPRQDPHGEAGVVAIFAQRLRDKQPLQINAMLEKGDDGCVRDYVYVKDVVSANLAALEGRVSEPIMNVGTGEPTTTKQLIAHLQQELGSGSEVVYADRRAGDLMRSLLDPTRCVATIGAATPIAQGLLETARWFKGRP
jgi:UDP-glucose 4-epimerase